MSSRTPFDRLAALVRDQGAAGLLFVSPNGSSRALLAAALFSKMVEAHPSLRGRFTADFATTTPGERIHPQCMEMLRAYRLPAPAMKRGRLAPSMAEALNEPSAQIDFVIALQDRGAGEPGVRVGRGVTTADWSIADPRRDGRHGESVVGSRLGFVRCGQTLSVRIATLLDALARETQWTAGEARGVAAGAATAASALGEPLGEPIRAAVLASSAGGSVRDAGLRSEELGRARRMARGMASDAPYHRASGERFMAPPEARQISRAAPRRGGPADAAPLPLGRIARR
ncbi:MAG: hypothetical protein AAF909_15565 [Pseudomonadota bacterium]